MKRTASIFVLSHFDGCGKWLDFAGFSTRAEAIAAGKNHTNWFGSQNKVRRMGVAAFQKLRPRLPFIQIHVPGKDAHS